MELLYGAALQQRQQGGPQPQGGLFPGKTHMGNDSSHGQQQDHPHQTQQQGATAQHRTTLATAVWGQQWAGLLVGSSTEANFSVEADRKGLAREQDELLSLMCQHTLTQSNLAQPLLSHTTELPAAWLCQVVPRAACLWPIHIYLCVLMCCSLPGKL